MNKQSKITRVASTVGILLGAFALSVFATNTWTPPHGSPTDCPSGYPGCDAPLNVAAGAQSKVGGALYLNTGSSPLAEGLRVWGTATFNNAATFNGAVKIASGGGANANKILTSGSDGTISWTSAPAAAIPHTGRVDWYEKQFINGIITHHCGALNSDGSGSDGFCADKSGLVFKNLGCNNGKVLLDTIADASAVADVFTIHHVGYCVVPF